eukprot:jgi/Bigna1/80765/fgenesh1_pg.74_\
MNNEESVDQKLQHAPEPHGRQAFARSRASTTLVARTCQHPVEESFRWRGGEESRKKNIVNECPEEQVHEILVLEVPNESPLARPWLAAVYCCASLSTSSSSPINSGKDPAVAMAAISERAVEAAKPKAFYRQFEGELLKNKYDKDSNPDGCVMLSLAENTLAADIMLEKYQKAPSLDLSDSMYSNYQGILAFREAIASNIFAKHFKVQADADDIFLGVGASVLANQLCWSIANPGDGVLIPTPFYGAFSYDITVRNDLHLVRIQREAANDYALTTNMLESAYDDAMEKGVKPKILMLCSPDNPLGRLQTESELINILSWCAEKPDIHIVSDELYALSVHSKKGNFVSVLEIVSKFFPQMSARTHILWAASKDFGASGFRMGVLHTKNEDIKAVFRNLGVYVAVSNPIQREDQEFVKYFVKEVGVALVSTELVWCF